VDEKLDELSETGLLAADRHQRRMMEEVDESEFAEFLHSKFIVNGPNNLSGAKEQMLLLSQGGAFGRENSERRVERTSITGNTGVVMGDEIVNPEERSLLAAWFGQGPIRRRFTDTYVFEGGRWLLLACQASVVREARRFKAG
jgi:hypothetical protein